MGWFKPQYWSWILISAAVCVSCQTLTSTLHEGNRTCPGEVVNFTCAVRETTLSSFVLAWTSTEYIGQGDLLQFSTTNMRGETATSMINSNVVATLVNNTNDNGVLVLESVLRIVADQPSMVMCSVTSGGTASIEFSISEPPGVPLNVRAAEIQEPDDNCIILVTWSLPVGSNGSDIDHYIVYAPPQEILDDNQQSAISILSIDSCRDIRIQVAAVNRLGCEGMNSSEIHVEPIQVDPLTDEASATTTPTAAITPTGGQGSSISSSTVAITIACVVIVFLITIVISVAIFCYLYRHQKKGYRRLEEDYSQKYQALEEISKSQSEAFDQETFQKALEDLFVALKFDSPFEMKMSVDRLREILKKDTPPSHIKEALKRALVTIKWEEGHYVKSALDRLMTRIPNTLPKLDDGLKDIKVTMEMLCEAAKKKEHEAVFNRLIRKLDEVEPKKVKKLLSDLCSELQVQGVYSRSTSVEPPPSASSRPTSVQPPPSLISRPTSDKPPPSLSSRPTFVPSLSSCPTSVEPPPLLRSRPTSVEPPPSLSSRPTSDKPPPSSSSHPTSVQPPPSQRAFPPMTGSPGQAWAEIEVDGNIFPRSRTEADGTELEERKPSPTTVI